MSKVVWPCSGLDWNILLEAMKLFVGITDFEWYSLHASKPKIDEVNFWRPSPQAGFKALCIGEPVLSNGMPLGISSLVAGSSASLSNRPPRTHISVLRDQSVTVIVAPGPSPPPSAGL
jgi:hypothetical protein